MNSYFDQFEQQLHQAARAQVQLRPARRGSPGRSDAVSSAATGIRWPRRWRTLPQLPPMRITLPALAAILLSVVIGLGAVLLVRAKPHATTVMQQSSGVSAAELAHGHWSELARLPKGARQPLVFAWDGHELLAIGDGGFLMHRPPVYSRASAYDPVTGRWHPIASVPASVQLGATISVWTGSRLFVFGAPPETHTHIKSTRVAGLYDPATNRWTTTSPAPVGPFAEGAATAVWSGGRVIVAGIGKQHFQMASYDPASNTWSKLHPPIDPRHQPYGSALVATNDGVLLWSLWAGSASSPRSKRPHYVSGVDVLRYHPGGGWSRVPGSWPQRWAPQGPIFTGKVILLSSSVQTLCGTVGCGSVLPDFHGYEVNPRTLARTPIPRGPYDRSGPQIVWTGRAEIAVNLTVGIGNEQVPGDIAFWNPSSGKWTRGPRAPVGPEGLLPAVWTGSRLYVMSQGGRLQAYGP